MKKLELNNFGVQELSAQEMMENEGGWIFRWLWLVEPYHPIHMREYA